MYYCSAWDITSGAAQPTEEQMEKYMQQWNDWIGSIVSRVQLVEGGRHLSKEGRVLKPENEEIEKPYTSENISVAGYIIIAAKNIKDASDIARD